MRKPKNWIARIRMVYKDPTDTDFWHPFLIEKFGIEIYLAKAYWRTAAWLDIKDIGLEELEDLAFEFHCRPRSYINPDAVVRVNLMGDACTR